MKSENVTYKGVEEITKDTTVSSGEYESTNSDENAILVSGDITSSLSNITVTKKGDSTSADGSSFYGNNSAILSKSGATLTLDNINVTLVSKASEGIVIEEKNKVTINNTKLTDSNTKLNGQSTTYKNIFLYQSVSGDASTGTAEFTSKNSDIATNNGDTFYVTNTTATINLTNNKITNNDSKGNFLKVRKDSWGNSGSNGGDVTLNMTNQEADGDIVIDSISTLNMNLKEKSLFTGKINSENSAKNIKLVLDKTSKIKLTGDSYVSSLEDEDSSYDNIDFNGYKLYVNGTASKIE